MSLTPPERETVVTLNDEDDFAHVYTAQRPIITKLRKNPSARLLEEGSFEGSVWARFELPASLVAFRNQRRPGRMLSPEEREANAARLADARAACSNRAPQTAATVENTA